MRLCIEAARGGTGLAGMWIRAMGGNAEEADKSGCAVALEDATGFHEFLFNL